jgi:hypothetical protein
MANEGEMDELVAKVADDAGVDKAVARNAVIIVLKFLLREGPTDKVSAVIEVLPGAREAIATSDAGGSAGVMGAFNDLSAAGLGMTEMQVAARSFGAFAREKAGAETIDDIVASVPGLGSFV